ncbi:MAG TPA: metabolite traffic protein EboE [Flavitalea sp.]|nr:metabolite traffic protein EboE [Flavitalea sp.]
MQTSKGHLTYCTNIHPGETWTDHFRILKQNIPLIKKKVCPVQPFGIGLRLANAASLELRKQENLEEFQQWLGENNCYVFTMNGFPYGGFHHSIVKDQVHAPDWLSADRVAYTIRLAQILASLIPEGIDGGISTSPLSYKFWHKDDQLPEVFETATFNLLQVLDQLIQINRATGKLIHIDIEPEPDGLLGNGKEFLQWYLQYLLPLGIPYIQDRYNINEDEAASVIREHIQLCYDVCHFAVGYEDHAHMVEQLRSLGIKTGKIQISAALRSKMPAQTQERKNFIEAFQKFNEPVYLHQVVARKEDGQLVRYRDLNLALDDAMNLEITEWRAHYHVPLFVSSYGMLHSTRSDIEKVLTIQDHSMFTFHLEIETYTWEVLPEDMRLPVAESIIREIQWVIDIIKHESTHTGQAYA